MDRKQYQREYQKKYRQTHKADRREYMREMRRLGRDGNLKARFELMKRHTFYRQIGWAPWW